VARLERRLPPLLSVIAGMVDVIGFLSLGLFTAHVTVNLVVIAALLVRGGPPKMAQVTRSRAAFFLRMATRVSKSGGWMSAIRPHSKRERKRSSTSGIFFGAESLEMMICFRDS
jgi:uncharacterized membrane protein YoaK (UPF0700 family)